MTDEEELNQSLRFDQLTIDQQRSFRPSPPPIHVRLVEGFQLYKWTEYGLVKPGGSVSEYWSPWDAMKFNGQHVPGFVELRARYANRPGEVGRPQEFMRARSAVTQEWNSMSSLTKARLQQPTWGFLGFCAHQLVSTDPGARNLFFIGGAFQLVIPKLTPGKIIKL